MKKTGIGFIIAAVVIMILQFVLFTNLNHNNAVDSNSQTVYINGFRSFLWPSFVGIALFMAGVVTLIINWDQHGHRYE